MFNLSRLGSALQKRLQVADSYVAKTHQKSRFCAKKADNNKVTVKKPLRLVIMAFLPAFAWVMEGNSFFRCREQLFAKVVENRTLRVGMARPETIPPIGVSTPRLDIVLDSEGTPRVAHVILRETGELVGSLHYVPIAEGVVSIHVKEFTIKKKGYGTEAKFYLMKEAFKQGARMIHEYISPDNLASTLLHRKLGYVQEDTFYWNITAEDFSKLEFKLENDKEFARDFFSARTFAEDEK